MRGESREEQLGGGCEELRFEHVGRSVGLPREAARRQLGGQSGTRVQGLSGRWQCGSPRDGIYSHGAA